MESDKMDILSHDRPIYDESDPFFTLETLRHQEVSPLLIANILFKLCDPKVSCVEDNLIKLANFAIEKLIYESPLNEILRSFDCIEFNKKLFKNLQFDYNRFFHFCRILCSSDKQGYDILGLVFFSKPWKSNAYFQLEFIKFCIRSNNVALILSSCHNASFQLNKFVPQIETLKSQPDYDSDINLVPWKYQCLYQILVDLSENQILYQIVEEIFFIPLNKCPDLLVFGLLECYGSNTRLKEIVLIKAILKFLYPTSAHQNSTQIFQRIWPNDFNHTSVTSLTWSQRLLLTSMIELYSSSSPEEQQQKLSRILDLSQDLKALNLLLSSNSHLFVIDLACLASRREYLKLDKWLNDKILSIGQSFIEACLAFLKRRCPAFGPNESNTMTFPNETFGIILTCLRQFIVDNPKNLTEYEIMKMFSKYTQWLQQAQIAPNSFINPTKPNQFDANILGMNVQSFTDNQLLNQIRATTSNQPNSTNNQIFFPDIEQEFSKEIEEEADSYFQKIYNQDQPDSLSIDQVLEMLKKFQESQTKREKEVFACMIRNLFKEYPFLNQYPDKELVITGEIFGGIILYDFVKGYSFVGALRYVLESLKKPINSRYFTFGQAALNKFKTRLKEFPQFCQHLFNISHFRDFPAVLIEYIEYGKQSLEPPPLTPANGSIFGNNIFNSKKMLPNSSINVSVSNLNFVNKSNLPNSSDDLVLNVPEIAPPNILQDKISFIINNLSQINLSKKADEFLDLLMKEKEQYHQWISQYFVMKRVSLESNFHELYANFVLKLAMSDLAKMILQETYRNIKILLRSNKETDNFNDRTLLKNLGQWLGLITIGQNKPILSIDLDLRNLLIEAYHKGIQQLLYVVPFVAKVISGCAKSKVFRPPNPWTDSLISMLVELHSEQDLKLNLKFEVEVLCKNLELDINIYVGKSTILKNKDLFSKIEPQLSATVSILQQSPIVSNLSNLTPDQVMPSLPTPPPIIPLEMHQTSPSLLVTHSNANLHNYNEINISNISNLSHSLLIQPNLQLILLNPALKGIIKALIEKSVQEWINYISDRVIKVPIVTTETLVKKDFAKEPNPELMRIAAQNMLKCLIAGFSLINTKESLSNRIHMNIQTLLQSKVKNVSKEVIDSTSLAIVNDNIDLCVCFVQKTCIERGLEELDKKMKSEFESAAFQNEALKSKSGSISLKQMSVYEEMGRNIPGFLSFSGPIPTNLAQLENFMKNTAAASSNIGSSIPNYSMVQNELPPPLQVNNQVVDSFVFIYDKLISQMNELIQEFDYVHYNTEAMHQVLEILRHSKQDPRDQTTAMTLIKNVIIAFRELIINADNGVSDFAVISRVRDFYLILLKALTDQRAFNVRFTTTNITRFVMEQWITMNQSFPDELFDTLSRASLINFAYMDNEFFQFLENGQNTVAINVILNFLKCYLSTGITANLFTNTLELLQRIALKVNLSNHPLLTDLKSIITLARLNHSGSNLSNSEIIETALVEKADLIIKDWINNFNSPKNSLNTSFSFIVKNMSTQGLLKNDELISRFFKIFLELCVNRCYQVFSFGTQHQTVQENEIHTKCYEYIDAFSVLVLLFIKQSGNQGNIDQKFQFLNKILHILVTTANKDQEMHLQEFQPLPYYRILITIFVEFFYWPSNLGIQEFMYHDGFFEAFKMHIVRSYCNILHYLSPLKVPSFSYAWIDFISHRVFIGKCLDNNAQFNSKSWNNYFILLNDLLTFLKPILQNIELPMSNNQLYKGTLKLFLLLLHDFPEFLAEYCFHLCELIPFKAVQLRNIVLSAIPPNVIPLPEPLNSNLKLETLNEILQPVRNATNMQLFESIPFKKELDNYFVSRSPANFGNDLSGLFNFGPDKTMVYNISLINALTLYIGHSAILAIKNITINSVTNSPFIDIFTSLLRAFDSQGRHILLNSMADHLRYPNNDTLFYICAILAIFNDTNEHVREQIVRVLLERLIALRPHPWGIVFTVNELIRNPNYKLLDHNFIKCIPEVEKILTNLFQGVLNSIGYVSNSMNCNDVLLVDSR